MISHEMLGPTDLGVYQYFRFTLLIGGGGGGGGLQILYQSLQKARGEQLSISIVIISFQQASANNYPTEVNYIASPVISFLSNKSKKFRSSRVVKVAVYKIQILKK